MGETLQRLWRHHDALTLQDAREVGPVVGLHVLPAPRTITVPGHTIDARQPHGVHLSIAGAAVAASLVIDRLRADGALP